jgi:hypothetical protein
VSGALPPDRWVSHLDKHFTGDREDLIAASCWYLSCGYVIVWLKGWQRQPCKPCQVQSITGSQRQSIHRACSHVTVIQLEGPDVKSYVCRS